jgi:ligand-binding SRPBCC domain-containing protein
MPNFRFEHRVEAPIQRVFDFHADPGNLSALHQGWKGFRLLHHGCLFPENSTLWFEQTAAACVPVVFGFQRTLFQPPSCIIGEIIHGPFRRLTHVLEFEPCDGGTVVRDLLDVELPWYYGGGLVIRSYVAPVLRSLFAFRHRALERWAHCERTATLLSHSERRC